jgi:hypothetical protein
MKLLLAVALVFLGVAQDRNASVYGSKEQGIALPQVVKQVAAQYTREAMQQMIEDAVAVKAMKQWKFKPGTKDGNAVNVRVDVKMRFTLR